MLATQTMHLSLFHKCARRHLTHYCSNYFVIYHQNKCFIFKTVDKNGLKPEAIEEHKPQLSGLSCFTALNCDTDAYRKIAAGFVTDLQRIYY